MLVGVGGPASQKTIASAASKLSRFNGMGLAEGLFKLRTDQLWNK